MVTKGLTKKQRAGFVLPRLKRFSKTRIRELLIQHQLLVDKQIARSGSGQGLDRFETFYVAEYNPFVKPFRLTKRIEFRKDPKTGKLVKTGFFFQVVYKDPKTGRNLPSPLREYTNTVMGKIEKAKGFTVNIEEAQHLKEHLTHKLQEKHIQSLRAFIKAKIQQRVIVREKI